MPEIANDITELIGKTPLLRLDRYAEKHSLAASVIGKLEYKNPAASAKDRIALAMISDAEKSGRLRPGSVIIEPTSGNTGIGLAAVAAVRGYKVILTMPETMSAERRKLLAAYGAELVLTDGAGGMRSAISAAETSAKTIPDSFIPGQFTNPANPKAHRETTGPEIWDDTGGKIDILVAGVGTGGTITGAGEFLKSQNPDIHIIAVEPFDSPVLSEGRAGPHGIQGIGAGFIPEILNIHIYDEIIKVTGEQAFSAARDAAGTEGILIGISSGAALWAATEAAKRPENAGRTMVVILPDSGERYLSTQLFGEK